MIFNRRVEIIFNKKGQLKLDGQSKICNLSMLNQTIIGKFRTILEWVMILSGKQFKLVDEHETTKRCSICGHSEKTHR